MNVSVNPTVKPLKDLSINLLSFLDKQVVEKKKAFLLLWRLLLIRQWAILNRPHQLRSANGVLSSQEIWKQWEGCTEKVGIAIHEKMTILERVNGFHLGYLSSANFFNWSNFSDDLLRRLIFEISAGFRIEMAEFAVETMGIILDQLLEEQWIKHSDLRKYWYPQSLVSLMVRLLEPQRDWCVYDPICAVGQLLKAVCSANVNDANQSQEEEEDKFRVTGEERSPEIRALARLYLALQELDQVRLTSGDFFSLPEWAGGKMCGYADGIISVFPLLQEDWKRMLPFSNQGYFVFGSPSETEREVAYLDSFTKIIKLVKRTVVVMPPGFLFREWDLKFRQDWVDSDLLTAVITLPTNLFYHTAMPTVLLVLENEKPELRKNEVLFVEASKKFSKPDNSLDYERIVEIYTAFQTIPAVSQRVTTQQIQEEGYNLSVSRYLASVSVPYDWNQAWNKEVQSFNELEEQRNQALQSINNCLLRLKINHYSTLD
jgi:type I restriction enzyme M protein